MIKVKLQFSSYCKNEFLSNSIVLKYKNPVKLLEVLKDAKITPANLWLIKIGDSIAKEDYQLTKSCEIKLLRIIGGG
jgi:hypothetical protein